MRLHFDRLLRTLVIAYERLQSCINPFPLSA